MSGLKREESVLPPSQKQIMLYLAEIINIECHSTIKCGKYKIGFIIRHQMTSDHISRITHLTPFANFFWYSLHNIPKSENLRQIAKDWEKQVLQKFEQDRIVSKREIF